MRLLACLFALWLLLGAAGDGRAAAEGAGLWQVGGQIGAFRITDIVRHPEYIRIGLSSPQQDATRLELVPAERGGRLCTPFVCLQAAPGETLPAGLVEAAHAQIVEYEKVHGDPQWFLVIRHRPDRNPDVFGAPLEERARAYWAWVAGIFALLCAGLLLGLSLRRRGVATRRVALLSRLFLWGLTLYPALFVVVIVAAFAGQLLRVSLRDTEESIRQLETQLAGKRGPGFEVREEGGKLCFDVSGAPRCFAQTPGPRVLVFGGSSVVLPVYERSFPALLEQRLKEMGHADAQVVNLGVPGYDSTAILERLRVSLPRFRPDLVIFYMGHNDYTAAYRSPVVTDVHLIAPSATLSALAWLAFRWGDHRAEGLPWQPEISQFGPFLKARAEPALIQASQELRLLRLPSVSQRLNALVLAHFSSNVEEMLARCAQADAAVLLITPISNLEAPVYGETPQSHAEQRRALAIGDYGERLAALRGVKDRDVFSLDIRAKTPLLEFLRSIKSPGVVFLDLEKSFENEKFSFGFEDFRDYVHFLQPTHERLAERIAHKISENSPFSAASDED